MSDKMLRIVMIVGWQVGASGQLYHNGDTSEPHNERLALITLV